MALSNFERMIQLAEDAFSAKSDPDQLQVNEKAMKALQALHPATMSEYDDGKGPVVWILIIPTTGELMKKFLDKTISEQQLLDHTSPAAAFEAIYLCSAMTLPEYRNKGIARRLTLEAIAEIRKGHAIKTLFVWPFSEEGKKLAEKIAQSTGLPLLVRD